MLSMYMYLFVHSVQQYPYIMHTQLVIHHQTDTCMLADPYIYIQI